MSVKRHYFPALLLASMLAPAPGYAGSIAIYNCSSATHIFSFATFDPNTFETSPDPTNVTIPKNESREGTCKNWMCTVCIVGVGNCINAGSTLTYAGYWHSGKPRPQDGDCVE